MSIIERKLRQKEATRTSILKAAMQIVREEDWQSLSMRRIADVIEYTAPAIYEYFSSKDDLLAELTRQGFLKLARAMQAAGQNFQEPAAMLTAMWLAYWNFAHTEKEFYQLMFGVGTNCSTYAVSVSEANKISDIVTPVIRRLTGLTAGTECKYYAYWSAVHGLVSLNLLDRTGSAELNEEVLLNAIHGITAMEVSSSGAKHMEGSLTGSKVI